MGFHPVPISLDFMDILALITPFGMFRMLTPGISKANDGDKFNLITDEVLEGKERVTKSIDDILGECLGLNHCYLIASRVLAKVVEKDMAMS